MNFAVEPQDEAGVGATEPGRVFDEGFKHRLQIEGRTANHLEHFTRRRLLLQCLGEIVVTLLQFFEQPHVLDRDNCLVSEGFKKRYLLFAKRLDLLSANVNHPNRIAFAEQGSS
jgi:hypothetical protein